MTGFSDLLDQVAHPPIKDSLAKIIELARDSGIYVAELEGIPSSGSVMKIKQQAGSDGFKSAPEPVIEMIAQKRPEMIFIYPLYNKLTKVEQSTVLRYYGALIKAFSADEKESAFQNFFTEVRAACNKRLTDSIGRVHAVAIFLIYPSMTVRCDLGDFFECSTELPAHLKYLDSDAYDDSLTDVETEEQRLENERCDREIQARAEKINDMARELSTEKKLGFARNSDQRRAVADLFFGNRLAEFDTQEVGQIATQASDIFELEILPVMVSDLKKSGKTPKDISEELGISAAKAKKIYAVV